MGARARKLEIDGGDLDGVLYLRNADDALALKARVGDAQDVVVIGGGFIGLEAASSLQKMGKNVTVLEFGPRLVGRAVGEETAEYFLQAHRARGLDIRLNTSAARFTADGAEGNGTAPSPASNSRTAPCCPRRSCWSASGSSPTPSWPNSSA